MNIEKIEVNGHYVWVDKDAEICNVKGREDWNYCPNSNQIFKGWDKDSDDLYMMGKNLKPNKIIAASPELNLEGVPSWEVYLAEHEADKEDWDFESPYGNGYEDFQNGFIKGYQAAKKEKSDELLTKYQEGMAKGLELCKGLYTEEQVKQIVEKSRETGLTAEYLMLL